jgi:non-ribosomal peptide synthetase component E (peptide arylation enzyme)
METQAAAWRANGKWSGSIIADHVRAAAKVDPNPVVLIDAGKIITSGELYGCASHAAKAGVASRLELSNVVSLQLPSWHEASALNLASGMAGLVINPIIPPCPDAELIHEHRRAPSG